MSCSKIFSMVVFAKRPLLLQELSEAVGMTYTKQESDLDSSKEPFKRRLKALCAPLIDVAESGQQTVCTLTHSTVQSFLLKHPQILQQRDNAAQPLTVPMIDEGEMAFACLKYLSQPRYRDVLVRSGDSFITSSGEDVAKHHMLSYAAKYWDRHLENLPCSEALFESVESFLHSPQFVTCLQIQSLCVEGQFTLWFSQMQMCTGYRRTFPRWFTDCGQRGQKLLSDYTRLVDEWGYLLDSGTGDIDRCLWGALGPGNFLSANSGRYDSFMYASTDEPFDSASHRYYDGIAPDGSPCWIVRVETRSVLLLSRIMLTVECLLKPNCLTALENALMRERMFHARPGNVLDHCPSFVARHQSLYLPAIRVGICTEKLSVTLK